MSAPSEKKKTYILLPNGDVQCLLCMLVVKKEGINKPDRCLQQGCPVKGSRS